MKIFKNNKTMISYIYTIYFISSTSSYHNRRHHRVMSVAKVTLIREIIKFGNRKGLGKNENVSQRKVEFCCLDKREKLNLKYRTNNSIVLESYLPMLLTRHTSTIKNRF